MNLIAKLSFLLYSGLFLLVLPLSFWWLFKAQTFVGKGIALIGFLLLACSTLIILRLRHKMSRQRLKRFGLPLFAILISIIAAILWQTPSGTPQSNSPIQNRFLGNNRFKHYALTNIVPEMDQVNLGFLIMPYLDPILTPKQANEAASSTMPLYREMEQDENFRELGSMMGEAYADLFGSPTNTGHYYLYIPQNENGKPLPAIVFLHGSAGNFKTYIWLWSKFAEEQGFVIIAPSYGFGNWDQASVSLVSQVIEDATQVVEIDPNQIYLAGLSNGGLGVSQLAKANGNTFRGLIFISPVMDTSIVDEASFQEQWAAHPVLVISGEADKRIPIRYVEQRVANLRMGNVDVTSIIYANADHFLFFSHSDEVFDDISSWLSAVSQ